MPIQPIDLQTLFVRLNQVGKDQAVQKEASQVAQSVQGSEIVKRSEEDTKTVNQSKRIDKGPEEISDEKEQSAGSGTGSESRKKDETREEGEKRPVFEDPDLGKKIDISG
jgi:hypothetical protein